MLNSITIKNFRSCENVELRLDDPVIALLGKNGAGKTNLLHAIQLVTDLCSGKSEPSFRVLPLDPNLPTEFTLSFTVDSTLHVYRYSRSPQSNHEKFEESLTCDGVLVFRRKNEEIEAPKAELLKRAYIGMNAASVSALLQILPMSDPVTHMLRPVEKYLGAVSYYPLLPGFQEHTGPEYQNYFSIVHGTSYEAWKKNCSKEQTKQPILIRLLFLHLEDKVRFEELKKILGPDGLSLLDDIRVEEVAFVRNSDGSKKETQDNPTAERTYAISFMPGPELAGSRRWFSAWGLSAGTRRILQLITHLIFDQNSCMLLEQPEDSIHAGLLSKVIDILQTYAGRTQLICTTHSPRVIDLVGPSGIRLVSAKDGRTFVSELSKKQLGVAKRYIDDEGTLSEFLEIL